jgi:hypothetical protein
MWYEAFYEQAINNMETTVHALAKRLPPPQKVPFHEGFAYRYVEKSLHQALVQKLARYVSGLQAAHLLLEHGYVQEQAALQRMLDEVQEDITFLAFGAISDDITPLHARYLEAFYQEEFDAPTAVTSTQKREMVPRQKIRAYIAREGQALDPSRAGEVTRTVSKAYSGYVHAASPHIMDMYGGNPPHFHLRGMRGTPRQNEHRKDLWNYFYRGILVFGFAVKAFGDDELFSRIGDFAAKFADQAGEDYGLTPKTQGT